MYQNTAKPAPAKDPIDARVTDGFRLNSIATIPVAIHIVLPNPNMVSDKDVMDYLRRLNEDFSGLNADSTNGPNWYSRRGHSQMRFVLAKRTPAGAYTTGINRIASSTQSNAYATVDPIKRSSLGGADNWDPSSYFNIWVGVDGSGQGILGYAQFPGNGGGIPANDGLFLNVLSFSTNPCYTASDFRLSRTGVHEVGHYFGLYHIWGDDGTACTGDDFRQLPTGSTPLPAGLFNPSGQGNTASDVGDTPNQAGYTSGCPSGVRTDACSSTAPGIMYQNFMDYTNDACYSLFTVKQVERMEWVIANIRSSLITSLGATPPAGAPLLDAALAALVSPGGSEATNAGTCVSYPTPYCAGPVTPKVKVANRGVNTLTSVGVAISVNAGAAAVQTFPINLLPGYDTVLTLNSINLVTGANALKIYTTAPNGGTDNVNSNDTLNTTITIASPQTAPVSQNFDAAATAGIAPWSITSDGSNPVWQISLPAGIPPSSTTNVYSAVINNYSYDGGGKYDDINSPPVNLTGVTALDIRFDVAYQPYSAALTDSLVVLISKDCGLTFTEVYRKGGTALGTKAGYSGNVAFSPASSAEWRTETISLTSAQLSGGTGLLVKFRNVARYGNRLWLDNIRIGAPISVDISANAITRPNTTECGAFTPTFTARNTGGVALTGFKAGYILNNGTPVIQTVNVNLASNTNTTVTFPSITAPAGNNTIKFFVADPLTASGPAVDAVPTNDTLTRTFSAPPIVAAINEGFEGSTFAPSGWSVINNDPGTITWQRTSPGRNSSFSAFINNSDYGPNQEGQLDFLQLPLVNTSGADALVVTFDVAHKYYAEPGFTSADRLRVLSSTNCGTSFTSVFSKSGTTLATAGMSQEAYVNPGPNDWRKETVNITVGSTVTSILLRFENRTDWGNNTFIDNVTVTPRFKRDLQVLDVKPPVACSSSYVPVATILNNGTEAVTAYSVSYSINGGTPVETVVSGVNLAPNATANVTLTAATLAAGTNTIRVYSWKPVGASGTGDQFTLNDTITRTVYVAATVQDNIVQNFEGTAFPPAGWGIGNPDGGLTWQRSSVGKNSNGAAYVRNYVYYNLGQKDDLYSPVLAYTGADSVLLTFDLAASAKGYPGSTTSATDTLEVLVTRDCGNTFTSVYKKWGLDLQTLNMPNNPQLAEYLPVITAGYQWRKESINLTSYVPNGPLQVVFRNTNNNQNNVYIDNVSLTAKKLPAQLKQDGYLVQPSPFTNSFNVWFVSAPADLKYVTVFNSHGQQVWKKEYNSNSSNVINIDLSGRAAGIYIVKFGYAGKEVETKVLKVN